MQFIKRASEQQQQHQQQVGVCCVIYQTFHLGARPRASCGPQPAYGGRGPWISPPRRSLDNGKLKVDRWVTSVRHNGRCQARGGGGDNASLCCVPRASKQLRALLCPSQISSRLLDKQLCLIKSIADTGLGAEDANERHFHPVSLSLSLSLSLSVVFDAVY